MHSQRKAALNTLKNTTILAPRTTNFFFTQIFFGGGHADAPSMDIEIRRNHMRKPLVWMPSYKGTWHIRARAHTCTVHMHMHIHTPICAYTHIHLPL